MLKSLSLSDRKLIARLAGIALASVIAVSAASRFAEHVVLKSESGLHSERTVKSFEDNLSDLPAILKLGRASPRERAVFEHSALIGNVFRYRLLDAEGKVVVASRSEDLGRQNRKPYFDSIVRQGQTFSRVERRPWGGAFEDDHGVPYAEGVAVVGKRCVPIVRNSRFLGAIELYIDLTTVQSRLRSISTWFLGGLLVVMGLIGAACWASLNQNLRERRQSLRELNLAREGAEELGREARNMLHHLFLAEEERMNRMVGLIDGICHKIANPMATLSMSLSALEEPREPNQTGELEARIEVMRDAIEKVMSFLHSLGTLSVNDGKADFDINEIIRSIVGVVRLNDRTPRTEFVLDLSSDISAFSLPRRSVLLALFIVLNAIAESMSGTGSRVAIRSRWPEGSDSVQVRIDTAPSTQPGAIAPALEVSHAALNAARHIIESEGDRMTVLEQGSGVHVYEIDISLDLGGESGERR